MTLLDRDWDPTKTSRAIIASHHGHGVVLWHVGAHLDAEIEGVGLLYLGDLGLDDAPDGLSVWEGFYVAKPGMSGEPWDETMQPEGAFREPNALEWRAIQRKECPWDKSHWMIDAPSDEELGGEEP